MASWEGRLATLLEGLGLLQGIQRRWLYLAPIFSRGALPAVAARFRHVDGEFRSIMAQLEVGTVAYNARAQSHICLHVSIECPWLHLLSSSGTSWL